MNKAFLDEADMEASTCLDKAEIHFKAAGDMYDKHTEILQQLTLKMKAAEEAPNQEPRKKTKIQERCRYHANNKCMYGDDCRFTHSADAPLSAWTPKALTVCSFWVQGRCKHEGLCEFLHTDPAAASSSMGSQTLNSYIQTLQQRQAQRAYADYEEL